MIVVVSVANEFNVWPQRHGDENNTTHPVISNVKDRFDFNKSEAIILYSTDETAYSLSQ